MKIFSNNFVLAHTVAKPVLLFVFSGKYRAYGKKCTKTSRLVSIVTGLSEFSLAYGLSYRPK